MIACCVALFLALLVAALFDASANQWEEAENNPTHDMRFASHYEVKTLLLQALRHKAWSGRYKTGRLRLTLPEDFPERGKLRVRSLFWDEASRRFSARITVSEPYHRVQKNARQGARHGEETAHERPVLRTISLRGEAIPYVRVLAARRVLLYGTRLTRADLKKVERPASRKLTYALTDIDQALGMEVRFRRKAGDILRARDLRPARLVKRRSTVQVTYRHNGVRVVLQALALNDGTHGETVRLRNKFSGREFLAVVDGAGHATVRSQIFKAGTNEQDSALEASTTGEQRKRADNPFRAQRQKRYDDLLNEPLSDNSVGRTP